ncbi:uncharacterized protein N7511_000810 [Penicillium nucicola]|uniref:uncharacterized protein n=1 Tax=Penicillium nucicola TaxID=1850975 RepID=UPI0025450763|nr:uncharacterized protein N7511_000810 [Penicillium nucicola]KAJ5775799.1 hypothetical protein N7511_000810 [Penicillium nucicola]
MVSSPQINTSSSTSRRLQAGKAEKGLRYGIQRTDLNIEEPISKLTEHYDLSIKDMETWVARPAEIRRKEALAKGKVARPMNSFMLYRSFYSERIKQLAGVNNHQAVSKIAGQGWNSEPPDVRKKYADLAKLERDAHAAAHPEYKYSPAKRRRGPVKRRKGAVNHRNEVTWSESETEADLTVSGMTPVPPYVPPHNLSLEEGYFNANQSFSPYGTLEHEMSHSWPNAIYSTGLPMYPESSHSLNGTTKGQVCTASHLQQDIHYSSSLIGFPGASHQELLQQTNYIQVASPMGPVRLVHPDASEAVEFPNIARATFTSGISTYSAYRDNMVTAAVPQGAHL